ncbi:MAG: 30S ribosomal protein S6 [Planctomycetia bacterium]|nr:30S ribosomal protein S6 [Planctomycetia bacterium]
MKTREYEAMFLLDNAAAVADWDGTSGIVDQLLTKYGAEIVHKEKWDERKLAYEIRGHKRATYYLVYFKAASDVAAKVTADASLNDKIVRMLILTLDEPIADHIKKRAEERERLAEESRKASLAAGWGADDRPRRRRDDEEGGEVFEVPDVPELAEET